MGHSCHYCLKSLVLFDDRRDSESIRSTQGAEPVAGRGSYNTRFPHTPFETKWPPITASALSRRSYRKIGDCRQSIFCHAFGFRINVPLLFQGARSRLPTGCRTCILSSKIRRTKIYWWRFQSKATSKSCRLIVEQSICK